MRPLKIQEPHQGEFNRCMERRFTCEEEKKKTIFFCIHGSPAMISRGFRGRIGIPCTLKNFFRPISAVCSKFYLRR